MEGKAEKAFQDLGKKVDKMIAELAELKVQLKDKYGDRWEEINRSKNRLEEEMSQFKEKHKDRFNEAERNLEKAGSEIKKAFEAVFWKRDKTEPNNTQDDSSEH